MNLKNAVFYRYERLLKLTGVYFLLVTIPYIGIIAGSLFYKDKTYADIPIILYASIALALIYGVTSYDADLKFFLQNGITRQQAHLSFLAALPVCVAVAILERFYMFIMHAIIRGLSTPTYSIMADYFNYGKSFLKDILIEALIFVTLMCIGYLIKCIVKSFKPLTLIILAVVIIAAFALDLSLYSLDKKVAPEFSYMPQLFFLGSVYGEVLLRHFIAGLTIVSTTALSVAHIITLKCPIRMKEG